MNTSFLLKKGYFFFIIILIIGAVCKSLNAPLSALILEDTGPLTVTALLCTGAVIFGIFLFFSSKKEYKTNPVRRIQKKDTPWLLLTILADFLGNILFLTGLTMSLASSASLVKCFGLVATAVVAFVLLKERISKKLLIAISLITLGCITISAGNMEAFITSPGLILVFGSCICSGFSYTFKKKLAERNSGIMLIIIDGVIVILALIFAMILGEVIPDISVIIGGIVLGLVVFGITSLAFQLSARVLGASKCTTVMGFAPFIGAILSFIIFQNYPTLSFFISFVLLIPGFYLVITDKEDNRKKTELNASTPPPLVEEYHDIRNYLTSAGFLLVFAVMCVQLFESVTTLSEYLEGTIMFVAGFGIVAIQIIIGCLIIIFRRRDMSGIIMLLFGFITGLLISSGNNKTIIAYIGVLMALLGVIFLLATERKKYFYSILFFLFCISAFSYVVFESALIQIILNSLICLYVLILDIGASGLLPRFSLTKILAEDENKNFEKIGSTICYIIIAISVLPLMGTYILGLDFVNLELIGSFSIACGIMMGILSLLLIFVGKNRFLGVVFLCVTAFMILSGSVLGIMSYIPGVIMFLTGLFCLLRKKSYLLLGLLCILYGISSFTSIAIYGETVLVISQGLMHIVTFLVAVYMSFAVFLQNKRLPVF